VRPTEWTLKTAKAEEEAKQALAASALAQSVAMLDKEKTATAKQIASLEENCSSLQSALASLHQELAELQARAGNFEVEALNDVPVLQCVAAVRGARPGEAARLTRPNGG